MAEQPTKLDRQVARATDVHHRRQRRTHRLRWCRGKVGDKHTGVWRGYQAVPSIYDKWRVLVCTRCGKQLDHWYPPLWRGSRDPRPQPVIGSKGE